MEQWTESAASPFSNKNMETALKGAVSYVDAFRSSGPAIFVSRVSLACIVLYEYSKLTSVSPLKASEKLKAGRREGKLVIVHQSFSAILSNYTSRSNQQKYGLGIWTGAWRLVLESC